MEPTRSRVLCLSCRRTARRRSRRNGPGASSPRRATVRILVRIEDAALRTRASAQLAAWLPHRVVGAIYIEFSSGKCRSHFDVRRCVSCSTSSTISMAFLTLPPSAQICAALATLAASSSLCLISRPCSFICVSLPPATRASTFYASAGCARSHVRVRQHRVVFNWRSSRMWQVSSAQVLRLLRCRARAGPLLKTDRF